MLDKRFPITESKDIVVNMTFSTTVLTDGSGGEERNINWQSPLLSYDLQQVLIRKNQLQEIVEFFREARGAATMFRYRDWSDYSVTAEPKNTRYGSYTLGFLFPPANGVRTEFGLVKQYEVPSCTHLRGILLPDPDTVTIYSNNLTPIASTDWIFDAGKFIFTTPPAAGQLFVDGEFDVPVVFSSDEFQYRTKTTKDGNAYSIEGLQLEEIREYPFTLLYDEIAEIESPFALANYFDSIVGLREQTEIIDLASGFDKRSSRLQAPKQTFTLGKMPLRDEELEYLVAFFRCVKGKAMRWKLQRYEETLPMRFGDDTLTLRLNKQRRYEVDSLRAIETFEPFDVFQLPPFSIPLEPFFVDPQNLSTVQSSGESNYTGSLNTSGNGSSSSNFTLNTYQAQSVGIGGTPSSISAINANFSIVALFWATGTLHLLVSTTANGNNYTNRLIHYRLDLSNGWNFIYQQTSSEFLRGFYCTGTDIISPQFAGGGILGFRAAPSVFSSGTTPTTSGNIVIKYDESNISFEFINSSQYNVSSSLVIRTRHDNKIWLSSSGTYTEYTINDHTYIKGNIGISGVSGFPYYANYPEKEYEHNIWVSPALESQKRIIREGANILFEFFPQNSSNVYIPVLNISFGNDGSYVIKALLTKACENGVYGCTDANAKDLVCFFKKESFDSPAILIDVQNYATSASFGDSFSIQRTNTTKRASDRYGNMLLPSSSKLIYYRAGSGYSINIASKLGFSASNIKGKPTNTPYGFAVIAHSGNVFSSAVNLAFIQNK